METTKEMSSNELPEGCIAKALSFTTPEDVGRLSAVSPLFKSAADSDDVWERFLPSDLESILSTSPDGPLLLASGSSKKELYFRLCDNPVLVGHRRKVQQELVQAVKDPRDELLHLKWHVYFMKLIQSNKFLTILLM